MSDKQTRPPITACLTLCCLCLKNKLNKILQNPLDSVIMTTAAPVAQLDRVPGYELGGRTFESCRVRHIRKTPAVMTSLSINVFRMIGSKNEGPRNLTITSSLLPIIRRAIAPTRRAPQMDEFLRLNAP